MRVFRFDRRTTCQPQIQYASLLFTAVHRDVKLTNEFFQNLLKRFHNSSIILLLFKLCELFLNHEKAFWVFFRAFKSGFFKQPFPM